MTLHLHFSVLSVILAIENYDRVAPQQDRNQFQPVEVTVAVTNLTKIIVPLEVHVEVFERVYVAQDRKIMKKTTKSRRMII